MNQQSLEQWHKVVFERDFENLYALLDENVVFRTPTLWSPKEGRDVAFFILKSVIEIFEDFKYHREWIDGDSMALEFSATVEGKGIKGIDLIRWNEEGLITEFEVILRPLNGLQLVFELMSSRLRESGLV